MYPLSWCNKKYISRDWRRRENSENSDRLTLWLLGFSVIKKILVWNFR
jgi:hypothetical protein